MWLKVGIAVVLVIGVVGLWSGSIWLYRRSQRSLPPPGPPPPDLRADVAWNAAGLSIRNTDPEKRVLRNVVVRLNLGSFGKSDADCGSQDIRPNEKVGIPFLGCVDDDRRRFNILERDVQTIFIKGELESGVKSTGLFICSGPGVCVRSPK